MKEPTMQAVVLSAAQAGYTSAILDAVETVRDQMGATAETIRLVTALQSLAGKASARVQASYERAAKEVN